MDSYDRKLGAKFLLVIIILLMLGISGRCGNNSQIDSLKTLLVEHNVHHVDIVLAQAVLETGWFKCNHCSWQRNNPFGFFWKGQYKKFRDLDHAVFYYKTWQAKWYKDGEDYYDFLKRIGYAEDPGYISKLKNSNLITIN